MLNDQLTIIKSRKDFYRDNYRRACFALWMALAIIFMMSLSIFYLYIQQPLPDFYATSMNGNLTQLQALSSPNYSSKPLIQ